MSRAISDRKNLLEAQKLKASGFPTKIHASPHKDLIVKWLLDSRFSSRIIVNELKKVCGNEECTEGHPSDRAIDNYKIKYLPNEVRDLGRVGIVDEIIEKIKNEFDPVYELMELYREQVYRISLDRKHEDSVKKLFPHLKDEYTVALNILKELTQVMFDIGALQKRPTVAELNVNFGGTIESPGPEGVAILIEEYQRITRIISNREESGDTGFAGFEQGQSVGVAQVSSDGIVRVQKQLAPPGVVHDTGKPRQQEDSHSSSQEPR